MLQDFLGFNYSLEYGFTLILINIFIYLFLVSTIFGIFFFFKISSIQTLGDLRVLNVFKFYTVTIILTLLSLAGVPPLLGFVGKFLLIMVLLGLNNYMFFIYLTILNLFMLYFYLQNIRFIISKNKTTTTNTINNYVSADLGCINIICFINCFNFFGLFVFEDMYIVCLSFFI